MALDHIVINVLREMDAAARIFEDLGFRVTPRGYHTLGSINHLMLEPGAYLELVGLPETGPMRQEVLESPFGLNGLVFRSDDADATRAGLSRAGFSPSEPVEFSRPVDLDGETRDARFRTVRLPAAAFPAGRVYFCQHLTPELVWQPSWMSHPNGYRGISEILVQSPDVEAESADYASLTEGKAERELDGSWSVRDDRFTIRLRQSDEARFAGLTLIFDDIRTIAANAERTLGVSWLDEPGGAGTIEIPLLDLSLPCRSAAK